MNKHETQQAILEAKRHGKEASENGFSREFIMYGCTFPLLQAAWLEGFDENKAARIEVMS